MWSIRKPSEEAVGEFLINLKDKNFSYDCLRGTFEARSKEDLQRDERLKGFNADFYREKLGDGEHVFEKAKQALRSWKHFGVDWVQVFHPDTPIVVGADVAILAAAMGVYTLSGARIVYVIDESQTPVRRFGFAHGTLETHVASGEERFLVTYNTVSEEVHYELMSFSQANKWYTMIGYPVTRIVQDQFARESIEALKAWVNSDPVVNVEKPEIYIV